MTTPALIAGHGEDPPDVPDCPGVVTRTAPATCDAVDVVLASSVLVTVVIVVVTVVVVVTLVVGSTTTA